jgi:hypothetical protein
MNKIRRWLDSRKQSLKKGQKVSVPGFMAELEKELGSEAASNLNEILNKNVPFAMRRFVTQEVSALMFADAYMYEPGFRQMTMQLMPSNFHRSLLEKSVKEYVEFAGELFTHITVGDLHKGVRARDWKRVTNKTNEDAPLVVDHKPHMQQFPVHAEYSKMLESSKKHEGHRLEENGISAKMIHKQGDDTFMAKPYHKSVERATKSWVKNPILGWAAMATKALYNAGKISHLAEDVSTHEHEGVPLTVHKFAADHMPMSGNMDFGGNYGSSGALKLKQDVDPTDVHKIAVMDYLTNNIDRHHGNLMIGKHTSATGFHPVLAIDHERSFQYHRPMDYMAKWWHTDAEDTKRETPWAYLRGSPALRSSHKAQNWSSHEGLVDWWNQHGQGIKDEMENQLGSIKDEHVRKHVRDNFTERWHAMNDWSKRMAADTESAHFYHPSSLGDQFNAPRIIKQEQPKITAKQLKSLPKDKKDALFAISDIINRKERITPKQRYLLNDAIKHVVKSMSPEEAGDIFRSVVENPYMSSKSVKNEPDLDTRNVMLRHFWGWDRDEETGSPTDPKHEHMEAVIKAIDKLPEEQKEILRHWATQGRRLIEERRKAA